MSIITRFPPEPNGYLHLGHLKAMMFDFKKHSGCQCILRLDDTNPEVEKQHYVDSIIDDVEWLGLKPYKITYTSDYFEQLHIYAIELIKKNKAYVDLSSGAEIKEKRHAGIESVSRNYSIDWHLQQFEKMTHGQYLEDSAVLRLKIDMQNNNHTLRDPIAYRIKNAPHYRTGNQWKIYPTYDYSHGLVDSLENITYSYCTMEFDIRREQYYWPMKELGLYSAKVEEFGRLNVENNLLSKRKILSLVNNGSVSSLSDPRLLTLRGLRRRGFTPQILKDIVAHFGMNRHDSNIKKGLIDYHLRDVLNLTSPRAFAVIDPIEVDISDHVGEKVCKNGDHSTILSKKIYIDRTDFREIDDKSYYRLAPNKTVRLRYADFIEYVSHEKQGSLVTKIIVKNVIPPNPKKIRGIIHWVSESDLVAVNFELYQDLLANENYNPLSIIITSGYVEKYVMEDITKTYQFERLGYFKFDRWENQIPVFIRVVGLVDKYN